MGDTGRTSCYDNYEPPSAVPCPGTPARGTGRESECVQVCAEHLRADGSQANSSSSSSSGSIGANRGWISRLCAHWFANLFTQSLLLVLPRVLSPALRLFVITHVPPPRHALSFQLLPSRSPFVYFSPCPVSSLPSLDEISLTATGRPSGTAH